MSGVNALDTKRMDGHMEKGEGIEYGMCTQRMKGRARDKEREREQERRNNRERQNTRTDI